VGALQAQGPTTASQPPDCGPFVQQFYNWYVGQAKCLDEKQQPRIGAGGDAPRETIPLSPELVEGLKRRSSSLQKIAGEIAGWISIPFSMPRILLTLPSGNITPKGIITGRVFGVWNGQKNSKS